MSTHGLFDAHSLGPRQGQIYALWLCEAHTARDGFAQGSQQARQDALQLLGFVLAFRCSLRRQRESHGGLWLTATLQHADRTFASARVAVGCMQAQRQGQITVALALPGDAQQQLAAAIFQPFVGVRCRWDVLQDRFSGVTRLEAFSAAMQTQIGIHIGAFMEGP